MGNSNKPTILTVCTPTQFALQCNHWFHDGLKCFFHSFITLKANVWNELYPPFLFAVHLECSLNTSVDEKLNKVGLFATLCSTLVGGSNKVFFSSAWFYFLLKYIKEQEKS